MAGVCIMYVGKCGFWKMSRYIIRYCSAASGISTALPVFQETYLPVVLCLCHVGGSLVNSVIDHSPYYTPLAQLSYFHWEPSLGNWVVSPVKGGVVRPLHFSPFLLILILAKKKILKNFFPPLSTGHYPPPLLLRFPPVSPATRLLPQFYSLFHTPMALGFLFHLLISKSVKYRHPPFHSCPL